MNNLAVLPTHTPHSITEHFLPSSDKNTQWQGLAIDALLLRDGVS